MGDGSTVGAMGSGGAAGVGERADPEAKLKAMGLSLPIPPAPVAAYIPWRRTGSLPSFGTSTPRTWSVATWRSSS